MNPLKNGLPQICLHSNKYHEDVKVNIVNGQNFNDFINLLQGSDHCPLSINLRLDTKSMQEHLLGKRTPPRLCAIHRAYKLKVQTTLYETLNLSPIKPNYQCCYIIFPHDCQFTNHFIQPSDFVTLKVGVIPHNFEKSAEAACLAYTFFNAHYIIVSTVLIQSNVFLKERQRKNSITRWCCPVFNILKLCSNRFIQSPFPTTVSSILNHSHTPTQQIPLESSTNSLIKDNVHWLRQLLIKTKGCWIATFHIETMQLRKFVNHSTLTPIDDFDTKLVSNLDNHRPLIFLYNQSSTEKLSRSLPQNSTCLPWKAEMQRKLLFLGKKESKKYFEQMQQAPLCKGHGYVIYAFITIISR
jgi:hypothetical protein